MILDHAKLGCTFTFMKDLASVVALRFLLKTLIWAGGKSTKEDYLQNYSMHFYIYNFVKIIIVRILRGYS